METSSSVELPERWANPDLLQWAREQVGLDHIQAARWARTSPEQIRAWESGEVLPTLQDLETLGEIYDCPVGYFFLDSPPMEEAPRLDYRGISADKLDSLSYESRIRLRQFNKLMDISAALISSLGISWEVSVASESLNNPVEEVAARVVKQLGVTSEVLGELATDEEAFNLWRTRVEGQGILVFSLRLNPGELRGASLWESPRPPAILVNHADVEAASGRTFTLLHEYAHLLVRNPGIVCDFRGQADLGKVEGFANRFATGALASRLNLESYLANQGLNTYREHWSDAEVERLRRPFHVSRDVIRILLQEMAYAPPGSYSSWRARIDTRKPWGRGSRGGQTKAALRKRELGTNFPRLLAQADQHSLISKLDLADVLDMKVEQAEKFLESFR